MTCSKFGNATECLHVWKQQSGLSIVEKLKNVTNLHHKQLYTGQLTFSLMSVSYTRFSRTPWNSTAHTNYTYCILMSNSSLPFKKNIFRLHFILCIILNPQLGSIQWLAAEVSQLESSSSAAGPSSWSWNTWIISFAVENSTISCGEEREERNVEYGRWYKII